MKSSAFFSSLGRLFEAREEELPCEVRSLQRIFGGELLISELKEMDCTVTIGLPDEWMITERWVSAEALEKKIAQKKYLEMFCWKLRFAHC